MPTVLEAGTVYYSHEFEIANHLCACGCGTKITTPLGPAEWSIHETVDGPTLYPSIGNWQLPCKSHYFIHRGEAIWATEWNYDEIVAGRLAEVRRRSHYYENRHRSRRNLFRRMWNLIKRQVRRWLFK